MSPCCEEKARKGTGKQGQRSTGLPLLNQKMLEADSDVGGHTRVDHTEKADAQRSHYCRALIDAYRKARVS
jgi:hypothetical protein